MPSLQHSAGALLFCFNPTIRKNEFLLLKHALGHWDFPKGHLEKGETEEGACAREIKEETGLDAVSFQPGFRERISYSFREKGGLVKKEVSYFLGESQNKSVKLSPEHLGFAWAPFEQAFTLLPFENQKELLKKARKFLENHRPAGLPKS